MGCSFMRKDRLYLYTFLAITLLFVIIGGIAAKYFVRLGAEHLLTTHLETSKRETKEISALVGSHFKANIPKVQIQKYLLDSKYIELKAKDPLEAQKIRFLNQSTQDIARLKDLHTEELQKVISENDEKWKAKMKKMAEDHQNEITKLDRKVFKLKHQIMIKDDDINGFKKFVSQIIKKDIYIDMGSKQNEEINLYANLPEWGIFDNFCISNIPCESIELNNVITNNLKSKVNNFVLNFDRKPLQKLIDFAQYADS